jgi:hypothetical protein
MYFQNDVSTFVDSGFNIKAYDILSGKLIYAVNVAGHNHTERYLKFVKLAHDHFERWGMDFGVLVSESEKVSKTLGKKPVFHNQQAMQLLGKYNQLFEDAVIAFHPRIIMPYATLIFQPNGNIDLNASNPYVFGVLYEYNQ